MGFWNEMEDVELWWIMISNLCRSPSRTDMSGLVADLMPLQGRPEWISCGFFKYMLHAVLRSTNQNRLRILTRLRKHAWHFIRCFCQKDDRRIPGKSQDLPGIDNDRGYWINTCMTSWQPCGRNGSFPTLHGAPSCAGMLHLDTSQCCHFWTPTGSVSRPGSVFFVHLRPCTKFATGLFFALLRKGWDYCWVPIFGHSRHLFLASFGGQRQLLLSAALDFLVWNWIRGIQGTSWVE